MKLKNAVEIGMGCGLKYVEECIDNMILHGAQYFPYEDIIIEIDEMLSEFEELNFKWVYTPINYYISISNLEIVYETEEQKIYNCPILRRRYNG